MSAERDAESTEKLLFEIKCQLKEAQKELIEFEHMKEDDRIQGQMLTKEVQVWRERALDAEKRLDDTKKIEDEVEYLRSIGSNFVVFMIEIILCDPKYKQTSATKLVSNWSWWNERTTAQNGRDWNRKQKASRRFGSQYVGSWKVQVFKPEAEKKTKWNKWRACYSEYKPDNSNK